MESTEASLKGVNMSEIDRRNMLVGISGASAGIGYLIPTTGKAEEKLTVWQPIETAPKDGTLVMLYLPQRDNLKSYIGVGYWEDYGRYTPPGGRVYRYGQLVKEEGEDSYSVKKWYISGWPDPKPTHWIPLPDPPQTA